MQQNQAAQKDPILQMQQQELKLKQQEAQVSAQKAMADIEIDKAKIAVDKLKIETDERIAGAKIGANASLDNRKINAKELMDTLSNNLSYESLIVDSNIAKISIVGVGMRSNAGVASQMFDVLSKNNINIDVISTSEIKISVLINKDLTEKALNTLHEHFELGNTN